MVVNYNHLIKKVPVKYHFNDVQLDSITTE